MSPSVCDGRVLMCRFARYHENNTLEYGLAGDDKYAREFADFDYTS